MRFLDRIKARKVSLSDGLSLRGDVVEEGMWPIRQLVSAYSGADVIPTFPGIYTMLHNEYEYEASYPLSDNPSDSFERGFLCRVSDGVNSDVCTLDSKKGDSSSVTQDEDPVTQGEDPVTQEDEDPVTQEDEDPVTQEDEDPVTQEDEDPVTQEDENPVTQEDEDPVTQDEDPYSQFHQWIELLNSSLGRLLSEK